MIIHLLFCFSESSWEQLFRFECYKMFAKYLKNIIERVNVLVERYQKRTQSQVFPNILHRQLVLFYDL